MVVFINRSIAVRATAYVLWLWNWICVSGAAKAFAEGWGDLADAEAHGETWEHLGLKRFDASTEWISMDRGYATNSRRSCGRGRSDRDQRVASLCSSQGSRGTNGHVGALTLRFRASKPTNIGIFVILHAFTRWAEVTPLFTPVSGPVKIFAGFRQTCAQNILLVVVFSSSQSLPVLKAEQQKTFCCLQPNFRLFFGGRAQDQP